MSHQPDQINFHVDMDPLLRVVEALLCGREEVSQQDMQSALREIQTVVRAAQLDPMAPHEFYAQFGCNVFVHLTRRICSDKLTADLLERLKPN